MRRAPVIGAVAALLAMLATAGGVARASQLITVPIPATAGEISSQWIGYPGPPRANVLLPTGYNRHRAYPLLLLLHGLNSNYNWYATSGVEQLLSDMHAIVVMPEGGSGWYTDWWNNGERANPSWESYELDEVLPYVLQNYKIRPQRRYHAIAGISMGGLGATYLGGRLPGFFGTVATLSGFVDPQVYGPLVAAVEPLTSAAPLKGDLDLDAVEGPTNGFYAVGHNPAALVDNLLRTRVFQSTGNGVPTSTDPKSLLKGLGDDLAEGGVIYPMNQAYHAALAAAGVQSTYQTHPGGHTISNFEGELKALLVWGLFKPVVSNSTAWANQTVAGAGELWGISYRFAAAPTAVVEFRRTGRSLSISAAGSDVTLRLTAAHGCTIHAATPATITLPRRCLPGRTGRKPQ